MIKCERNISIIRNIRDEKGVLLKKVAADLNLNKSVLQAIESGRKSTIAERAHSIAAFYNRPVEELFVPTYYRARIV
ncbi:helix-turn-helix domain-containing protein [Bacillus pseudomycoides]|uniref:helix-turn-helix domain-containing protein n=1 Tax=Bacillus pseudomycoides TaxID=64104 RepID=UPI000BFC2E48|nr:helix-turn-helix domain-containing protein [Bacillus pseudomycoides]PGE04279.1 transcriptional regulator [Bacillus pseudomycoides]PHG20752.1 transcriptional regulator [Bacillus pseudomycoides]